MNYTYLGYFITAYLTVMLFRIQAYAHLLIAILLISFYLLVVKSGKFPKLEKFVDDAF